MEILKNGFKRKNHGSAVSGARGRVYPSRADAATDGNAPDGRQTLKNRNKINGRGLKMPALWAFT